MTDWATRTQSAQRNNTPASAAAYEGPAAAKPATRRLQWDPRLIDDYSEARAAEAPASGTYLSHFQRGNKNLFYVASHHARGTDTHTARSVRHTVESCQPEVIVVEGIPTSWGISPQKISSTVLERLAQNPQQMMENEYAAALATQHHIPFIGGEPQDNVIFDALLKQGYTQDDLMGFYLLRQYNHEWQKLDRTAQEHYVDHYTGELFSHIPAEQRMNLERFEAWFNYHSPKPLAEIKQYDLAPLSHGHFFQQMSHQVGIIRELNLDGVIADLLEKHNNVMVVYGGGHLAKSRRLFEHALGKEASYVLTR